MAKRVSHSYIDPWLMPWIKGLYRHLHIPASYPPEGIIAVGHLFAILAAVGFAYATTRWWGGLLVAVGVVANHLADCMDGTHARTTQQCRNGGELLDHFVDPLSFSYYLCGLAVSIGRLDLGLAAVICLYATAVLTNIKAKMIGEFTLAAFGPTEFKALLVGYGCLSLVLQSRARQGFFPEWLTALGLAQGFLWILLIVGILQLTWNLMRSVQEVNAATSAPDTTDWQVKQ